MITPEHEAVATAGSGVAGFGDAVTFAFGDLRQGVFGSARIGLIPSPPAPQLLASSLGLLFERGELVAVEASGGVELDAADWNELTIGDVGATIERPLEAWSVSYDGDDGGFVLRFEALSPPAELDERAKAAKAAALHGYEQLCRVRGTARVGERRVEIDCLGQRGHQWGAPDWERITLARTVSAWFEDGPAVTLSSVRPDGATNHAEEAVSAYLVGDEVTAIGAPLLSTTLDGDGRQRRAGLELWVTDEAPPHRAAGAAVCGTTLDLGRLRLDSAFFEWRMDGRDGVGRYDVLRRA